MTRYVIVLGQIFANTTKKESYENHLCTNQEVSNGLESVSKWKLWESFGSKWLQNYVKRYDSGEVGTKEQRGYSVV